LDTIHAAVLSAKLPLLDHANHSRRIAAGVYEQLLEDTPLQLPRVMADVEHVFHLYVVQTDEREALRDHLASHGVSTGIHYPIPIHLQEAYHDLGYGLGDFPVSEAAARRIMSLPMFPEMTTEALVYVSDAIRAFFEGG
jgi:dTDP-4-amino-4,6-dideoxygalactose transaminase